MHTKVFKLAKPSEVIGDQFTGMKAYYSVPVLEAYALEYTELRVYQNLNGTSRTELLQGDGFDLENNYVRWDEYVQNIGNIHIPIFLIIHYHGVRNYKKLFPSVKMDEQKARLGKFYEEAERNFESGARLSFMLMCGAIFEGMLFDVLGEEVKEKERLKLKKKPKRRGFSDYIKDAFKAEIIENKEKYVMDEIRELRNLVHLNRYKDVYVSREQAMDTKKVLDDMIIRFSTMLGDANDKVT